MRPDCLILDEATAMLDPRGREQVMQTIHYLNKNMGITVVSITHYMEEAAQADRVLVMSKGQCGHGGHPERGVQPDREGARPASGCAAGCLSCGMSWSRPASPCPEGIIDTGECAQALYELLQ